MSTIKITQLPLITHLNANTSNTVFVAVDTQAEITGRFTATTLAAGLYENNVLNVGNNSTITLPNVVAQFALRGESYVQTNFTNLSDGGTADYVITANTGTDTTYFVDLGFANKNFIPGSEYNSLGTSIEPMSGYLYVQGNTSGAVGGNLIVGTTSSNTETRFIAGGGTSANVIAKVTPAGLRLVNGKTLTFNDGTVQNTAWTGTGANATNLINGTKVANLASTGTLVLPASTEFSGAAIKSGAANKRMYIYGEGNSGLSSLYWGVSNDTPTLATTSEVYTDKNGATVKVVKGGTQSYWWFDSDGYLTLPGTVAPFNGDNVADWNTAYGWGDHAAAGYFANTSGTFGGNLNVNGNITIKGVGGIYQDTASPSIMVANTSANFAIQSNIRNKVWTFSEYGTLTTPGNVSVNGTLVLANSNFGATESAMTIKATANVGTPSNDGYMLHISGKQNTASRVVVDSYSATGNAYGLFAGRTARGTVDAPLAVANNDVLMRISGNGYGTTGFAPLGVARIDVIAAENHTDATRGSRIEFWNMPVGSNTLTNIATFNGTSATFTGTVNPQKGFIYTPSIFPSSQTAITIDFANNSVVRAQTATGLTATLSNLVTGKVVDAWITNTAGTNQTFTHGVSALNSTVNATSYNIPGTSTIYVKYWSMDGTLANTFVAITK